ncbi:Chromosome replication initiation inhibitor protein [Pseudomonas syringae pv. broussonetiae]|uniref:Chromosome replication initiation inhibitor protein n=1 Tax=Pseudomonas savastanoi TaxID=29438 RepID=A0A3M5BFE8_PSESS|nr:Chromosome replication initiation inhibitor protein [Pseudomonas syringae pv. broussonetiae]RMS23982.1 Chromosome replication initiation inhibitor protein [Pseudomonas savastanoi]RMT30795.1 Chromosome replication initiation inhibitor protein [Pseudomonas savastanoi]
MFDYKLLSALAAVIEQAGFERASQVLGLSQSAVSQRIKLLEARIGLPVLVRATPPSPTDIGRRLLNHVQQVRLLERDLQSQVPALDEEGMPERLRIALNADSLATWWAPAIGAFCTQHRLLLDLVVEDQDVGLKRMRAGEVAACLCGSERPVAGARSQLLGAMRYRALASPFIHRPPFSARREPGKSGQIGSTGVWAGRPFAASLSGTSWRSGRLRASFVPVVRRFHTYDRGRDGLGPGARVAGARPIAQRHPA